MDIVILKFANVAFDHEKPQASKHFRVGDLLDFAQWARVDQANLYLIRDIVLVLDYGRIIDGLPHIVFKFVGNPVVTQSSAHAFPQVSTALAYIHEHCDRDYRLEEK